MTINVFKWLADMTAAGIKNLFKEGGFKCGRDGMKVQS